MLLFRAFFFETYCGYSTSVPSKTQESVDFKKKIVNFDIFLGEVLTLVLNKIGGLGKDYLVNFS